MVFGIEFAPMSVPLKRRLQTLCVLCYTLLFSAIPIVCLLVFIGLLLSPLAVIPLAYASWIVFDVAVKRTSSRGGRRWEMVRKLFVWKYMRDYFPVALQKTAELPTDCNYVFGYHPHGIMGCGAFVNFASEATGFSRQFPGIRPHLVTLKPNFRYPFIRALLLWMGVCDVSKESIEWILMKQGRGNAAIIVVGGAEEALAAYPGKYNITLRHRKGFVKMAIKTGASLVPVFSFGENDLFYQADNPHGSTLRRFQDTFKSIFGFSPIVFYGRGVFNYTFGFIPFRKPINTIVGSAIEVEQCADPETSVVDAVHQVYMDQLSQLFNDYKQQFGVDSSCTLNFV